MNLNLSYHIKMNYKNWTLLIEPLYHNLVVEFEIPPQYTVITYDSIKMLTNSANCSKKYFYLKIEQYAYDKF